MKNFKNILLIAFLTIISCTTDSIEKLDSTYEKPLSANFKNKILDNLLKTSDINYVDDFTTADDISFAMKTFTTSQDEFKKAFKLEKNHINLKSAISFKNDIINTGLTIHFYNKNSNKSHLYIYELSPDNTFTFQKEMFVDELNIDDLFYLRSEYFGSSDEINLLTLETPLNEKYQTEYSDLRLEKNLKKSAELAAKNLYFSKTEFESSKMWCGAVGPCQTGSGGACRPGIFYCAPMSGECPQEKTQEIGVSQNIADVNLFEIDKYYNIKDSFLNLTLKGREYIGKYYSVSEHFSSAVDLELTIKIISNLDDINNTIDNLNNPNYNGVIITNSLKNGLLDATAKLFESTNS
uniref:Exported protein n=1 Tax=uncultured Dokdonia sp. TaxID=575653 RepID=H8W400_9FLAO|nr:hypothetical protein [uncultured bacterium]CCG00814.1 exported protein [uncultured Dokdonia sp.]